MADQKETVLLDVQIENAAAVKNVADLKKKIDELTEANKVLIDKKKQNQELTKEERQQLVIYEQQVKALNTQIAEQTRIIQAEVKESRNLEGSYNALSAQLAQLKQEYKAVATDEDRQRILESLKVVNDRLVELDAQQGVFVRNVGNYAGGIQEAFGKIGDAAQQLGPAKDVLQKFGPEGQKAAAALDLLAKVLKLASNYGKVMTATQKAQTVATQAQTGAQVGLNAAMEANPIGIIIAAITALISIVQKLISIFNDATSETEKFNKSLEANAQLIEQTQKLAEFEARMAAAVGKSQAEQIEIRRKAAKEAVELADAEVKRLEEIQKNGSRKERKAAKEVMQQALEQQKAAYDQLTKLNEDATVQAAADRYKAEQDQLKEQEKAREERRKKRQEEAKQRQAEEKAAADALAAQREEMLKRTRSQYDNEIAELEKKRDKEIQVAGLTADELLAIEDHYAEAIKAVREREKADREKQAKEEADRIKAEEDEANKEAEEKAKERDELLKTHGVIAPDEGELEQQLMRLKKALDEGLLSEEEYANAVSNIYQRIAEDKAATVIDFAQQVMGTIDTIMGAVEENENAQMEEYLARNEEKKEALKQRLDDGLITQAEYENRVNALDADSEKKKKELDLKQAKRQKAMAIMNATLNAAGAIIASLAQSPVAIGPIPNPVGIASLALATATGIAQIAAAAATPLPKASRGMLITGPSHAQGGTLIEAEGGEAIINKRATSRYLPILSRINQSTGGIPLYGSGGVVGDAKIEQAAAGQQMTDAMANTPIYVTVVDINEGQERMAKVVERKSY